MVTKYGFSENVGLINYNNDDDEVFIGRDLAHTRGYGEGVASKIDEEVKRIIDECYAKARAIIQEIVMYSINQQTFFWKKKRLEEMNLKHYSRAELML